MVSAAPAHLQEAAAELVPAAAQGRRRPPAAKWRTTSRGSPPPSAAVFAVAAGAGMVLSGTDVGIVAALETGGHQREIGIVFLFWCAASVVGGLVYGAMHRPVSPIVLLLGMAALTIPMGFAHDTWTLAFVSLLPGLLCAPVLSAASEKVADLVAEERRGEAMGWYGSALTAGVALGAPLAGRLHRRHGTLRRVRVRGGCRRCCSASWDWSCSSAAPAQRRSRSSGSLLVHITPDFRAFEPA